MAFAAVLLAIAYHVISIADGAEWPSRYRPFYAAMLPFSLGACIYFCRQYIEKYSMRRVKLMSSAASFLAILNIFYCGLLGGLGGRNFTVFFYINLLLVTVLVACITYPYLKPIQGSKILGDLAYPIFLTHWIVGYVVSAILLDGEKRGITLLAFSIVPIVVISYLLVYISNRCFEPLRNKVRNGVVKNYP